MARLVAITGASGGSGERPFVSSPAAGTVWHCWPEVSWVLRGAEAEARELGAGEVLTISVDVADADAVAAAVERIESEMGPVDVWVNVAFTSVFSRFEHITPDEYRRATEVSYLGYVYATMAVLPRMRSRDSGTIVHCGSALAYRGIPLQTAYCGAKHAIQGFHEALRCELLHERSNVHVTMVQMPALNTPQFSWVLSKLPEHAQPVPPIYQPEVAARALAFAADHPKRREYWVGASTVATLAANALVPGLLDRYLGRTGFSSQQTGDLKTEGDPANLWEPADGEGGRDFGARGVFDDRAYASSPQQWVAHRYPQLSAATVGMVAVGALAWMLGRRR